MTIHELIAGGSAGLTVRSFVAAAYRRPPVGRHCWDLSGSPVEIRVKRAVIRAMDEGRRYTVVTLHGDDAVAFMSPLDRRPLPAGKGGVKMLFANIGTTGGFAFCKALYV